VQEEHTESVTIAQLTEQLRVTDEKVKNLTIDKDTLVKRVESVLAGVELTDRIKQDFAAEKQKNALLSGDLTAALSASATIEEQRATLQRRLDKIEQDKLHREQERLRSARLLAQPGPKASSPGDPKTVKAVVDARSKKDKRAESKAAALQQQKIVPAHSPSNGLQAAGGASSGPVAAVGGTKGTKGNGKGSEAVIEANAAADDRLRPVNAEEQEDVEAPLPSILEDIRREDATAAQEAVDAAKQEAMARGRSVWDAKQAGAGSGSQASAALPGTGRTPEQQRVWEASHKEQKDAVSGPLGKVPSYSDPDSSAGNSAGNSQPGSNAGSRASSRGRASSTLR
jgi:hypothetical protein